MLWSAKASVRPQTEPEYPEARAALTSWSLKVKVGLRTGIGPGTSAAASHREVLSPLLRAEDQGVVLLKELASFLTFGARKILSRLQLFFFFLQIWLF